MHQPHYLASRILILSFAVSFIAFLSGGTARAQETASGRSITDDIEYRQYRVDSPAGNVSVHMVLIDLDAVREGRLSVEPALPSDTMGGCASPEAIARHAGALAAINGPFFASSGGRIYPLGFIVLNGRLTQLGNLMRPLVGIDPDGEFKIEVAHPQAFIVSEVSFEPIWLWNVNTPAGSDAVTMYDDRWGSDVSPQGGTVVAVGPPNQEDNGVINITSEDFSGRKWDCEVASVSADNSLAVPDGGYALVFRGRWRDAAAYYPVGSKITVYVYELPEKFSRMRWLATLGPWFVSNGWVRDYSGETSYGGDITGRASRSVIGTTWNNEIFFAVTTGAGLTISEAADVMIECNVREAVMCDSGSSSGLWASGVGVRGGSREVPMAFVVRELDESLPSPPELRLWSGTLHRD
jgi:hypothetical protein